MPPAPLVTLALAAALAAAPPAPGHYADVRGLRMYYELHGAGPPLVLLHGGAGNGRQFEHQVPEFAKRFRLIVPDACAQGRTTDRQGPLTYHEMAEDVAALMDLLHVRSARVMGWSDGGVVGLDLAIHHPSRVTRLVTFGANFRADGLNAPDLAWNAAATADSFGPDMERAWKALAPDPSRYRDAMTRIIALWRDQPDFTPAELGRIRAKVLVVAGEHDVVRRDHTEALARAIPHARLWIVPGANHSVMVEQPAVVNPVVMDFLRR